MINYILILLMTLIAAFASFFLKKASGKGVILAIIRDKYIYIGCGLYIVSSVLNILILKRLPYSIVVPLGGTCYIWTMLIAWKFLGEKIRPGKIIGVVLILSGVVCIALFRF